MKVNTYLAYVMRIKYMWNVGHVFDKCLIKLNMYHVIEDMHGKFQEMSDMHVSGPDTSMV